MFLNTIESQYEPCWNCDLGGVLSHENTPEGCTETHKSSLFPYKQVSGRNGDHEWLRITNASLALQIFFKYTKRVGQHTKRKCIQCTTNKYIE